MLRRLFTLFLGLILTASLSYAADTTGLAATGEQIVHTIDQAGEIVTNTVDSVTSSVETLLPDSMELTYAQVYGDIKGGILGMADSLAIGAEAVFWILIKFQYAKAVVGLLFLFLFLAAAYLFIKHLKSPKELAQYEEWKVHDIIIAFAYGIAVLVSGIFAASHINDIIYGFIVPEYGAIKEIISFVK